MTNQSVNPATRTVTDFLGQDHRRLDGLMEETARLLSEGRAPEASRRFDEFRAGLLRHIRMEEEHLFPAFEQVTGIRGGGPTEVMRMEHARIKEVLDRIESCLRGERPESSGFLSLRTSLFAVLGPHNEKEEAVVYPMTDRALPPGARADLVRRMESI